MAQTVDQRDLLNSYRSGDLLASERLVRAHQNELLRSAFLLTGTAEGAVRLARDAFLAFFRRLLRGDVPEDARYGLLHSLGRTYLSDTQTDDGGNGAGSSAALVGAIPYGGEPQRYRVDDERSRVLTTLELLERPTRLGLVLRDFNMLEEEPVCQVLDETPFTLRAWLHPARTRIQDAGGRSGDFSVRELLVTAATSAPRPELWSEVSGPLERLHAEEDERRQRYTYLAAAGVGLLLVIAALWLFDVFPFGGGDGNTAAVAPTAEPAPTLTPEPAPTPTTPDLASFDIPQGDVPAQMLMLIFGDRDGQAGTLEAGSFDPATNSFVSYGQDPAPVYFPWISPDGRYLIGQRGVDASADAGEPRLIAFDSRTGERLWETDAPGETLAMAVTLDRIYAVSAFAVDDDEPVVLMEYDLASGELIAERPDVINAILANVTSFNRVQLWASPDNTRLFVALEERGEGPTTMLSRTLASFTLPELTFESSSIQTDSTSERQFPSDFNIYDARVTPDGQYLYAVGNDVVYFRNGRLEEDVDVQIQFGGPVAPGQPRDLRWIASNDGRYLYVLAVNRRQVAVVDLLGRRVAWSAPIAVDPAAGPVDWGAFDPSFAIGAGYNLALSPDGRYLYLAERLRGSDGSSFPANSLVLTVDVSTWTVTRAQEVAGQVFTLTHTADRLVALSQVRPAPDGTPYQLFYLDPESGAVSGEFHGEGLPEWAAEFAALSMVEQYRFAYGRAPAVDGAAPGVVETESTLPRVRVGASSDAIPAGGNVNLTVRVLHPVTGRFMDQPSEQARFDLSSTVVLRLYHEDAAAEDIILIANLAEPGVYRASTTIPAIGLWSAEVTITGSDGQAWTLAAPELFEGVPSWEATDGRAYVLRLETDPAEPPAGERVTVRARFVDVQTGRPLPATAELVEPFPDELNVTFRAGLAGTAAVRAALVEPGVYEGVANFPSPGVWNATIDFTRPGEGRFSVGSGAVTVVQ